MLTRLPQWAPARAVVALQESVALPPLLPRQRYPLLLEVLMPYIWTLLAQHPIHDQPSSTHHRPQRMTTLLCRLRKKTLAVDMPKAKYQSYWV